MTYQIQPIFLSGYVSGQAFYQDLKATSVSTSISNVGEVLQAVDGSINYLHRAYKRSWSFQWQMILYSGASTYPLDTVMKLRSVYESFGSIDTNMILSFEGVQYPVVAEPNSWSTDLSANSVSLTNVPYYTVSFRLLES